MTGRTTAMVVVLLAILAPVRAWGVEVADFVRRGSFEDLKISPRGDFFAATVPLDDRTALAILRRSDNALVATANLGKHTHVADFAWVDDDRVLFSDARKFGMLDRPQLAGNLYVTSASGARTEILVGQHLDVPTLGTSIRTKKAEAVAAFLVDELWAEDDSVLISVSPFTDDAFTRIEKMDLASGRRIPVGRAPVRRARFMADNSGNVRAAYGAGTDNVNKFYLRDGEGAAWRLVNDESITGRVEWPIGFSEDDSVIYLQSERTNGPDVIVAMEASSGERTTILVDDEVDPEHIVYRPYTHVPVGAHFMDGAARTEFFAPESPLARQYRSLEAAFPGQSVSVTSATRDGRYVLVQTDSAMNPGDFFLFDTQEKKAQHVISRRDWFDPAQMATVKPFTMTARDGLRLHGYLTIPRGSDGRDLPLVVMPHGGPYGVYDRWAFDDDVQLLASAGYAVLQVNFRGSGNRGRAFEAAGARQWGATMQDDVTDATRWAIDEEVADPARICIYGASYGAYAALMGAAREPDLYRCAAGYVGVYDLPLMHGSGDIQRRGSGETYLREWVGAPEALQAVSPSRLGDRIRVPVFLAAGGEDDRAPIEHSRRMERSLRAAGTEVDTLYYPTEGHGFYREENRQELYRRLLSFLARNIGDQAPAAH